MKIVIVRDERAAPYIIGCKDYLRLSHIPPSCQSQAQGFAGERDIFFQSGVHCLDVPLKPFNTDPY